MPYGQKPTRKEKWARLWWDIKHVADDDINPYVNEGSIVEGESSGRLPQTDVTYNGEGVFTVHPL